MQNSKTTKEKVILKKCRTLKTAEEFINIKIGEAIFNARYNIIFS